MEFSINCTRVPIPQGTTLYGIPVEVGPAPASPDSVSYLDAASAESYDGATPNPIGRAVPDRKEPVSTTTSSKSLRNYLINCRDNTIVSSLNTRTLVPLGRLNELTNNAKTQGIDIIAIQEHRFYHPNDTLKYHQLDTYQLVTSSASKNAANASVGGVRFLLSINPPVISLVLNPSLPEF